MKNHYYFVMILTMSKMPDITSMICDGESSGWGDYEGYRLTRAVKNGVPFFCFTYINHCSCHSHGSDQEEEDDHTLTLEELLELADNDLDPRVPDTETEDRHLKFIYMWVRFNRDSLVDPKWMGKCSFKIQTDDE